MKLQPNTQADPLMPSPAAAGPVQMARIVEHINQSEMHIGLRTSAFGSVEVHTVIHDSQVGLAMGGEKGDLRAFVSSELPDLQAAFQQHDLRFENIHFLSNTSTLGAGISSGTDSQSRPFHHAPQPAEIVPPSTIRCTVLVSQKRSTTTDQHSTCTHNRFQGEENALNANSSASADPTKSTNDTFMQLLTAQLKHQSPIDPVDPTQFTAQLVQFNMLDQLTQIRVLLQQAANAPVSTANVSHAIQGAR